MHSNGEKVQSFSHLSRGYSYILEFRRAQCPLVLGILNHHHGNLANNNSNDYQSASKHWFSRYFWSWKFQAGVLIDPIPACAFDPSNHDLLIEFRNVIWCIRHLCIPRMSFEKRLLRFSPRTLGITMIYSNTLQ